MEDEKYRTFFEHVGEVLFELVISWNCAFAYGTFKCQNSPSNNALKMQSPQ